MTIKVHCECGQSYFAKESMAGKSTTCRKCGRMQTVPQPEANAADEQELEAKPKSSRQKTPTVRCAECHAPLPENAEQCESCGFHQTHGKTRHIKEKSLASAKPKNDLFVTRLVLTLFTAALALAGTLFALNGVGTAAVFSFIGAIFAVVLLFMPSTGPQPGKSHGKRRRRRSGASYYASYHDGSYVDSGGGGESGCGGDGGDGGGGCGGGCGGGGCGGGDGG